MKSIQPNRTLTATNTNTQTLSYTNKHTLSQNHALTHKQTHIHKNTHKRKHYLTHRHAHAHTYTHKHIYGNTHTQTYTHTTHTHARPHSCIRSYKYTYEGHTIGFQTFFVWAFEIGIDSWKFTMLLLSILWDAWPIFMISGSNELLQQQLEYTLLKLDCHSWWISKMQSDTLEERYAIKFCFNLGKNATETNGMVQTTFCMNRASVFEWHKRFKEGRESVRDDERCVRCKEVNIPELICQRVRVRVTMLRF